MALPSQKIVFQKPDPQRTGGFPIKVTYNVKIVSDDATYASEEKSYYGSMDLHTLNAWMSKSVGSKGTTHSINYSG